MASHPRSIHHLYDRYRSNPSMETGNTKGSAFNKNTVQDPENKHDVGVRLRRCGRLAQRWRQARCRGQAVIRPVTPAQQNEALTMSQNDFYLQVAARQMAQLEAERAAHLARPPSELFEPRFGRCRRVTQALADNQVARENLTTLCNQYVASQQPPQKPYETPEQKAAKPWSQMGWDDIVDLTRTSRFARTSGRITRT